MNLTREQVVEFFTPLLESKGLTPNDVTEIIIRPGGIELVTFARGYNGEILTYNNELWRVSIDVPFTFNCNNCTDPE